MSGLNVRRSIHIEAPIDRLYASVRSFRDWPKWAPWLVIDPSRELVFLEGNAGFGWESSFSGHGTVEVVHEDAPRSLGLRMTFLKPHKSLANLLFDFQKSGSGVGYEVAWTVETARPYRGIKDLAEATAVLTNDQDRGLLMLKDLAETGRVPSKLEFPGKVFFPGGRYVGIRRKTTIADVPVSVPASFAKLGAWLEEKQIQPVGRRILVCRSWDLVKGTCELISAVKVGEGTVKGRLPAHFKSFHLDSGKSEIVRHTGPYRYLSSAWAAAKARVAALKLPVQRSGFPFEIYENDPESTPAEQLVTTLYFPLND